MMLSEALEGYSSVVTGFFPIVVRNDLASLLYNGSSYSGFSISFVERTGCIASVFFCIYRTLKEELLYGTT
ncbi:hypothetical protein J2T14_004399 [Paenibacillus harenae]|nr:hypothetical protein [Paenibacillus harenae]